MGNSCANLFGFKDYTPESNLTLDQSILQVEAGLFIDQKIEIRTPHSIQDVKYALMNSFTEFLKHQMEQFPNTIVHKIQLPTEAEFKAFVPKDFYLTLPKYLPLFQEEICHLSFVSRHLLQRDGKLPQRKTFTQTVLEIDQEDKLLKSLVKIQYKRNEHSPFIDYYTTLEPVNYVTLKEKQNVKGCGYPIIGCQEMYSKIWIAHLESIIDVKPSVSDNIPYFCWKGTKKSSFCVKIDKMQKMRLKVAYCYSERDKHTSLFFQPIDYQMPSTVCQPPTIKVHISPVSYIWKVLVQFVPDLPVGILFQSEIYASFIDIQANAQALFDNMTEVTCSSFTDSLYYSLTMIQVNLQQETLQVFQDLDETTQYDGFQFNSLMTVAQYKKFKQCFSKGKEK